VWDRRRTRPGIGHENRTEANIGSRGRIACVVAACAAAVAAQLCLASGASANSFPADEMTLFKLKHGKHTLEAVAIAASGNRDPTPAGVTVKVKRKKRR
jgi:hypothetical protein